MYVFAILINITSSLGKCQCAVNLRWINPSAMIGWPFCVFWAFKLSKRQDLCLSLYLRKNYGNYLKTKYIISTNTYPNCNSENDWKTTRWRESESLLTPFCRTIYSSRKLCMLLRRELINLSSAAFWWNRQVCSVSFAKFDYCWMLPVEYAAIAPKIWSYLYLIFYLFCI